MRGEICVINKWEQLAKDYPNQWAFMKNVKRNADDEIIDFDLLVVCPKSEKSKWLEHYMKGSEKFECVRTTFNAPNAGIWI